jgi:anthranilate synthase component I
LSIHARVHTSNQALCCESLPGNFPLYRLAQSQAQRYPYLLESTAQADRAVNTTSQYDILFAFPQAKLTKHADNTLSWNDQPLPASGFLPALDKLWQAQQQPMTPTELPFSGGWFMYLGYELVAEIEPRLNLPLATSALPIAQATRIPAAIIYDHHTDQTHLVAEAAYATCLAQMKSDLLSLASQTHKTTMPVMQLQEEAGDRYLHNVARVLDYIRAGDVYQVNLSRIWRGQFKKSASIIDVYSRLRECNPAPFAGLALFADGAILSSSPERLVQVRRGVIETRPIAGTRPRAATLNPDQQLQKELLSHPKERAEHVMLLDLERNDLGRICIPGTVRVNELMSLESYAHVHHIVSNVTGRLRANVTPAEIIRAVFPGGTITGCPKVRCMEIIAELERTPRGAYTGSFGYLSHTGDMDLNILIRSIVQDGNLITIQAGAGIVADSIAQRELEETRIKAKGMLAALQVH